MNKFVTSALAIATAGSLAHAGTGDSDWLELDREITSLSSSLTSAQDNGMGWSALLRVTASYSDDDIATGGTAGTPAPDLFGFSFEDIDLAFWGSVGDYGWRISMDGGAGGPGGTFVLEDAHVWFPIADFATGLIGSHKANTLLSSQTAPEGLLFLNRTALGSAFDGWDNGISAFGDLEMIRWSASITNGVALPNPAGAPATPQTSDHRYTVRLEFDLGEGAGDVEGALGAGDDFSATIGVVFVNDNAQDLKVGPTAGSDNEMYGLDFRGTIGPLGFGAEIASVGDDLALNIDEDYSSLALAAFGPPGVPPTFSDDATGVQLGGATPYAVYVSYLVTEDVEIGVRYEDIDNFADATVLSVGVSWYQSGHNAKWQAGWMDISTDPVVLPVLPVADGSIWQVGVSVGASG